MIGKSDTFDAPRPLGDEKSRIDFIFSQQVPLILF